MVEVPAVEGRWWTREGQSAPVEGCGRTPGRSWRSVPWEHHSLTVYLWFHTLPCWKADGGAGKSVGTLPWRKFFLVFAAPPAELPKSGSGHCDLLSSSCRALGVKGLVVRPTGDCTADCALGGGHANLFSWLFIFFRRLLKRRHAKALKNFLVMWVIIQTKIKIALRGTVFS